MNEVPITLVGRLARDPDLRHRSDGVAVVRFEVVVIERHQVDGQWRVRSTTRFACCAWRTLAEHVHASLGRGDRVVVLGRLRQREPSNDTESPFRYDVVVDEVGPSLRWTNVWPIAATSRSGESADVSTGGVVVSGLPEQRS